MFRIVFYVMVASLFASLFACSSAIPDQNQDPSKNKATSFRKDLTECKEDYPEQGSGVHIRQWQACMKLKGWK
jgi:hypothetical protein